MLLGFTLNIPGFCSQLDQTIAKRSVHAGDDHDHGVVVVF